MCVQQSDATYLLCVYVTELGPRQKFVLQAFILQGNKQRYTVQSAL